MGSTSASGARFTFNLKNGHLLRIEVGGSGFDGPDVSDFSWHHVAVTYNPANPTGQKTKLYVDGVLEVQNDLVMNVLASPNITIGARAGGANRFSGSMDEVRIWNVERTAAQILADKDKEYCDVPAGLIAYYKFNEGTANADNTGTTTVINSANSAYSGTLTNFALTGSTSNFVAGKILTGPVYITPTLANMNCGAASAIELTANVAVNWTLPGGDLYSDAAGTNAYATGTPSTSVYAKAVNNRYINGAYTIGGCTFADSALVTVNNATASALSDNTGAVNTDSIVINSATADLHNTDCELIASVTPAGGSPVNGWLTGKIFMDASVQNTATGPYVTRHFELTPNVNAATSNANITLYFTQTEFDAYNTYVINNGNANINPLLPSNPSGSTANILVDKFNAASGSPSPSNNNSAIAITPTSVTWDAANSWWAVTFPTTGFSGFFLHTNVNPTPLPVNWISTSATLNYQKQAVINWSVSEKETVAYQIQKSADGSNFAKLAAVNSKGNGNNAYSYTEGNILNEKAWYRIAQQGKDGKESYSKIMELQNSSIYGRISIYPNPAIQVLTVETEATATYSIYDLQGKAVLEGNLQAGKNTLNMSGFAKGFYTIKIGDYNQKIVLQ